MRFLSLLALSGCALVDAGGESHGGGGGGLTFGGEQNIGAGGPRRATCARSRALVLPTTW